MSVCVWFRIHAASVNIQSANIEAAVDHYLEKSIIFISSPFSFQLAPSCLYIILTPVLCWCVSPFPCSWLPWPDTQPEWEVRGDPYPWGYVVGQDAFLEPWERPLSMHPSYQYHWRYACIHQEGPTSSLTPLALSSCSTPSHLHCGVQLQGSAL